MLLAIDIGNSNIVIGGIDGDDIRFEARIATDRIKTSDQYGVEIKNMLDLFSVPVEEVEDCIISSVVPPVFNAVCTGVIKLTGLNPMVVGPGVKTGLNIRADVHNQLGSNIVASAVAAVALYPSPSIVINSGTALSFSYMRQASYEGCSIMPGMAIALEALSDNGAQLPHIAMGKVDSPLGRNTVDSMRAGVVYGYAGSIDRLIDEMEQSAGEKAASVVATGEYAPEIFRHCRHEIQYDRDLMVKGLYFLYRKNTTKRTR